MKVTESYPMTDSTRASLELLYNISRELTSALDLHTVLERILFLSSSNVGAERGSVIVMDDHQQPLDAAMVYENRIEQNMVGELKSTLDQGLAGWVVRNRQAVLVSDTSRDARWLRRPDDANDRSGAKSAICVPIMVREQMVGVLTLVHATPNTFGDEHLALVQAIADQSGIAMNNARLFESLGEARQRYQELFEDNIDSILVTTMDGKIQEANRQASEVSRRTRDALRGISIWELEEHDAGWLQDNLPQIQTGETVRYESYFYPLDRPPLPVEFYVRKINIDGQDLLQWIIRDISERKQLDTLRDDLSAMIYHDLRAPLANIISSLDMLRAILPFPEDEGSVMHQVLSIAIRSSERMQRLINSLLDINRLEAGQPIAKRTSVEVQPLILEAIENIHAMTLTRRQKVQVDIKGSMPNIWVDEDMIRRVLINLLENATKFTPPEGRIVVGASAESGSNGSWVQFWVQDAGPGIPEAAREVVFEKFTRLDIEHFPKGLGLGLAFCKLAVEAHGGRIGVESVMGAGSRFFFTAPVMPAETGQ